MKAGGSAIGFAVLLTAACGTPAVEGPPVTVRIATINQDLGDALARVYNEQIPGVQAAVAPADKSNANLYAVEAGRSDVAFVRADLAYEAHSQGTPQHPHPHRRLRGIAVVGRGLLHVVVPSGSPVHTVAELRGAPLGVASAWVSSRDGTASDANRGLYRRLLVAIGALHADGIEPVPIQPAEVMDALDTRMVAAALSLTPSETPALSRVTHRRLDLRLLEIAPDVALQIRAQHPFFKPALIPAGTYPGQEEDVRTVGVDTLLVCHESLAEEVVYSLVKTLFASLPELMETSEVMRTVDPDLAPATPIALHPGAARYYRERELPHY